MIAFGCATTDEREFRAGAAQAIEAVAESSSLLMRRAADGAFAVPYDEMLAEAASHDDLEAVVLLGQCVSGLDSELPAWVRGLLAASDDVAVVGAGTVGGAQEVESVGGTVLVLSAWAASELSCDAAVCGALDPLAMDLGLQARARGRRVVASGALSAVCRERWARPAAERRAWIRSMAAVRAKWGTSAIPEGSAV